MSGLGFVLPAASLGFGALLLKPQRGFFQAGDPNSPILIPHTVVDEKHSDRMHITEHPVEVGAVISDHAFKLPARVVIRCLWSNSPSSGGALSQALGLASAAAGRKLGTAIGIAGSIKSTISGIDTIQSILSGNAASQVVLIYQQLLALQSSATPCDVYTGKRSYRDILIEGVDVETTRESENSLMVVVDCKQLIMVDTETITVPMNISALSDPQSNMPTAESGARSLGPAPNFNSTTVP